MQIGSLNTTSSALATGQAESASASDEFKATTAFANVLANAFSGPGKARPELKAPETTTAAPAERPRPVEAKVEVRAEPRTDSRPEPRDEADTKAAADPAPKEKLKDTPKDKAPVHQASESQTQDDSAAETAAPAESPAAEATDETGGKPEQTEAEAEGAEKQVAEAAIDPNLILNLFIPAAQAAVPVVQAGAASQNGTQNGAQVGVAVDGNQAAAQSAADAALQQIQASVLSPEAQAQLTEAAKQAANGNAAQGNAKGEAKTGKIDIQASVDGGAPKPLVDPAALFADLLAQQGAAEGEAFDGQAMLGAEQQAAKLEIQAQLNAAPVAFTLETVAANGAADAGKGNNQAAITGIGVVNAAQPGATAVAQMQAQAARHPAALVPPGEQVAVQIKKAVAEGADTISIKLDPGNLGKVEVTLEVSHDGRLMAVIAADKPETLQMLQKDAAALEQSLRDNGMKTSSDSLSFQLRDQGQDNRGFAGNENGRRGYGRGGDEYGDAGALAGDARAMTAAADAQRAAARGGLDIRI